MMDPPKNPWGWEVNQWLSLSLYTVSVFSIIKALPQEARASIGELYLALLLPWLHPFPSLPLHTLHSSQQNLGKHKHPSSPRCYTRSCAGLGRTRCPSPHGEQGKHGDLTIEEWNGARDPLLQPPAASHLLTWPDGCHTLTHSPIHFLSQIIFFCLNLSAALIKHWIHVVRCLRWTVWGMKNTHQTLVTELHESSLERKTYLIVV